MHEDNKELLRLLNDCAAECNHCYNSCLIEQDIHLLKRCIQLDRDCADFCCVTASFIERGSEHVKHLLQECAEICNTCADECEKYMQMEHCKKCMEICRKCADACMKE